MLSSGAWYVDPELEVETALPAAPAWDDPATYDIAKFAYMGPEEGDKRTPDEDIADQISHYDTSLQADDSYSKLYYDEDNPAGPALMEVGIAKTGEEPRNQVEPYEGLLRFITGEGTLEGKGLLIVGLMLLAVVLGILVVLRR